MAEDTITNLKRLLIDSDKNAYEIAASCKMHPYTLSTYATGKKAILPHHLRALCKYFKVTQKEMLGTTTYEMNGDE